MIGEVSITVREEIFLHEVRLFLLPDTVWVVFTFLYYDLHKTYMSKKVAKKLEIMMSCTRLYIGSIER